MRPLPPPPEDSFDPYGLERAFNRAHRSFQISGRRRMDVGTFFGEHGESVTNLMAKELQDLDLVQAKTIA